MEEDSESEKLYGEEASATESEGEEELKHHSPEKRSPVKHIPIPEIIVEKSKSKLEKLLAQADIFDCLRRINLGLIRSYDDL
jgi:hypothetical protein